ncbi:MAG TPA: phosphomannose isomerase type II C-terminal cupin domain [Candidatus Paceibacterota bacterium]|nr:phosphomannose isomerase type II C-terminal cupin domain [Candidatus Paceibacterota bacterium]
MKDGTPYREERPWGSFLQFTHNEPSTVKILTINPGQAFSLQSHQHRTEQWHVISGTGTIDIGEQEVPVMPGKDYSIPANTLHRITATELPVVVLEIATGDFDENDITRIDDRYGRAA